MFESVNTHTQTTARWVNYKLTGSSELKTETRRFWHLILIKKVNQRTNRPVKAHLISRPRMFGKVKGTSYTFLHSFIKVYQTISRSQAAIISKESITVTFFYIKA